MSGPRSIGRARVLAIALVLLACVEAQYQRPSAAYAPLYTGLIKFTDVPVYGTPDAPPVIQPTGRKRRNANFPAAPELSSPVLERLHAGADGSSPGQRRKLQQQELSASGSVSSSQLQRAPFDYAAAFAASYAAPAAASAQRRTQRRQQERAAASSSGAGRRLQSQQAPFDYAAAFAASYAAPAAASTQRRTQRRQQERAAASSSGAGRRLQSQQAPFDYAAAFAASYAAPAAASTQRRTQRRQQERAAASSSGAGRRLQSQQAPFDYAAAFAASYAAPAAASTQRRTQRRRQERAAASSSSSGADRRLQQAAPPAKQRPGWTGLWWADAGGVGVAAGPTHVIHTISTAMSLYTLDPATGLEVESRTVALQDLFAPVGAANCKEGVYDAIPMYDKHAKRYLVAATCGGKGAVLLAATATPDPAGPWFLFMLLADAAQTGMACLSPPETAIADSVRLSHDSNGVYLSLFNYCPSNPAVQGASLLALPKHKVYKGAPNFVYAAFSADQILEAMPLEQRSGLAAASFKQCAAAPPQLEADAAGSAAYFVCDQAGPDVSPRGNFTLLALVNTGALWQFVGTRDSSPTPFLAARLVSRGGDAPLRSSVLQQQPERGSPLQAGGVKPAGFWSGSAVLSGGKVYAVDRIDVTTNPEPPGVPVTLPSLMWSEVAVQVSMSGAGDCTKTSAWGSNWDWSKDWSVDWGRDFDKEWKDNKNDADSMKDRVDDLEEAIRKNSNCTAPAAGQAQLQPATQVSDGSAATTDGRSATGNCSALNQTDLAPAGGEGGAAELPTVGGRRLAAAAHGSRVASGAVVSAWLAAKEAAQCRYAATEWMLQPLQSVHEDVSTPPSWLGWDDEERQLEAAAGSQQQLEEPTDAAGAASRRLAQVSLGGFINFDVGCWYCYYGKGFYYSSSWFYKYWYVRNAWGFGWYRRYKRNYAPGWSRPGKFVGRHLLEGEADMQETDELLHKQLAWAGQAGPRRLQQADGQLPSISPSQLQNETILIPPCLLSSTDYYKNTCKQCNYSRAVIRVTATPLRRGLLNATSSANPLGFSAPTVAVTPGGNVVVIAAYLGPSNHPNSSAPAYPGVGSFTIPPGAQGLNATWRVLRTGVGKVKSPSGRWSDFSTSAVSLTSSPSPVPGQPDVASLRVHYGVQWAQRQVQCAADETAAEGAAQEQLEFQPQCAMPAPWIGVLTLPA